MLTFAVIHIKEFETIQRVYKLLRNGKSNYDKFIEEVKTDNNIAPELGDLYAIIEDIANNKRLPITKYRKLHLKKKLNYSPYEAKSKHLRLYLFHDKEYGQIILFGGTKVEQSKDLSRVENLIIEYTNYAQEIKK